MRRSGRYDTSKLVETQFEPGSHGRVLKNLLGIKSNREMDRHEAVALKQAEDRLFRTYDKNHRFTAEDICDIHRIWLGGIYEWAGRFRNVDLSKGSFPFANVRQIPRLMQEFEEKFLHQHTPCIFDSRERIIQALAEVHVELILVHPFREGNGRVARILSTLMVLQAGLPLLDFRSLRGRKKEEYFAAIHASMAGDYERMKKIFDWILRRSTSFRRQL